MLPEYKLWCDRNEGKQIFTPSTCTSNPNMIIGNRITGEIVIGMQCQGRDWDCGTAIGGLDAESMQKNNNKNNRGAQHGQGTQKMSFLSYKLVAQRAQELLQIPSVLLLLSDAFMLDTSENFQLHFKYFPSIRKLLSRFCGHNNPNLSVRKLDTLHLARV